MIVDLRLRRRINHCKIDMRDGMEMVRFANLDEILCADAKLYDTGDNKAETKTRS